MKSCKQCNTKDFIKYNEEHDTYYCSACDIWLEDACESPGCDFCSGRPEHPSLVK